MADNKLKTEENKDLEKESDSGSESETSSKKGSSGDKNKKKNAAAKIKPPAKKRVKAEQTEENKKEKEKDAKKKKPAKVKEEVEDEDEDDEGSEGEENGVPEKVPLLDQPLEVSGSRERKQVQRFIPKENLKNDADKKVEIPDGKGTPLGDIPAIQYQLERLKIDTIKVLHKVLFNRVGPINLIKNNIELFKGFEFDKDSSDYKKKLASISKIKSAELKGVCAILDLPKTGKSSELAEKILDFLIVPEDSGREAPDPRPKRKGIKNKSYKEPKADGDDGEQSKKGKSKTSPGKKKGKDSSDEEEQEEEEEQESDDKRTEDENEEENETAESEEDKPKKGKKRGAPPKKAAVNSAAAGKKGGASGGTGGGANNKRGKEPKSESETENQSDSEEPVKDPPAKKSKNPPTDDEIKSYVKSVLEGANLEEITMKTVCKKVYEHYPDFDLGYKKEFIKNTVKSLISS